MKAITYALHPELEILKFDSGPKKILNDVAVVQVSGGEQLSTHIVQLDDGTFSKENSTQTIYG